MRATFQERQQFRNPWAFAGLLLLTAAATARTAGTLFERFILGGAQSKPYWVTAQMLVAILATAVAWLLIALLYRTRLEVTVDPEVLTIRYPPFARRRRVDRRTIRQTARVELPQRVSSWGIQTTRERSQYTLSGGSAVFISLSSGEQITLGTQRPDALIAALTRPESPPEAGPLSPTE